MVPQSKRVPFVLELLFFPAHFLQCLFPSGAVLYFLAQGKVVYQGKQSEGTDACRHHLWHFVALYLLGRRFQYLRHPLFEAPFSIDDHFMEGIGVRDEEYRIAMKL
jgi:hypothetical protein